MSFEELEKRAKNCVTHSYACDCREYFYRREITKLQDVVDILRESNSFLANLNSVDAKQKPVIWFAEAAIKARQTEALVKEILGE
jgi:predicted CoA-binding protein